MITMTTINKLKSLTIALLAIAALTHCASSDSYKIEGTIAPNLGIDTIYLYDLHHEVINTALVKNGKFTMIGKVESPIKATIGNVNHGLYDKVILENAKFTFKASEELVSVSGGKLHKTILGFYDIAEYKKELKEYIKYSHVLNDVDMENEIALNKARNDVEQSENKLFAIEFAHFRKILEGDYPPFTKLLALTYSQDWTGYPIEKQLDLLDKFENELGPNEIIEEHRTYLLEGEEMEENRVNIANGSQFKDVVGVDINGKEIQLSKVVKKNKFTILEFWASWCSPCRGEIPNIKKAYAKYKSLGLEVYSISLDEKKELWIQASEKENVPWISVLAPKAFNDIAAQEYGITGIPSSYLISNEGIIVAQNEELREFDLDRTLAKFFNVAK